MSKYRHPLWCLADEIEATLEVADEIVVNKSSDTEFNRITTMRHIGGIIACARIATAYLAREMSKEMDKEEGQKDEHD